MCWNAIAVASKKLLESHSTTFQLNLTPGKGGSTTGGSGGKAQQTILKFSLFLSIYPSAKQKSL